MTATESPNKKACNGLLQQNRPISDIRAVQQSGPEPDWLFPLLLNSRRRPSDDPKPLGTPEEEFEVTELKKNALDPTRQFVFQ
jgi:hypothetical protein